VSRRQPQLAALLDHLRPHVAAAQARWPSDSLDVPADPDARTALDEFRAVRRHLREAEYRARLLATPGVTDAEATAQLARYDDAVRGVQRLLLDLDSR